jgi:transcriptional regulator LmrA/YxaF-like protein
MLIGNIEQMAAIAARTTTPAQFLAAYLDDLRKEFASSDFEAGCPCAPIAIELAHANDAVRAQTERFFTQWPAELAKCLQNKGLSAESARELALLTVSAIEGALVISRSRRSVEVFRVVARQLVSLAAG